MKIVSTGDVCLYPEDIIELEKLGTLDIHEKATRDEDELIKRIGDADIVISMLVPITKKVIEACSKKNLKLVSLATTGFDDVDLDAATECGVTVCYTPGYATRAVAEHTIGLMISAARLSFAAALHRRKEVCGHCEYKGKQLHGRTLGVIGWGRIGKMVGDIAKNGLGMDILFVDKDSTREDFENLLTSSDFISLHTILNPSTKNMIGKKEFDLMKDGVVLVNTARGALVDEVELIENLKSGKVFAAGIDVLSPETNTQDNPLLSMSNVIVTPHIAYNTEGALVARSKIVRENILRFVEGNPQNAVCFKN